MRRLFDRLSASLSLVWLVMFAYTLVAGLLLQFLVLPHLLPAWHAGNGLIKGMDGPKFHGIAMEKYEEIQTKGWEAWELKAGAQLVSGVAAALYTLITPKPWVVLPLNAALNATACVCMVLLLNTMLEDRRRSLIAALPFLFFPSSLAWNTQMHNENYAVPAVIFLLLGWTLVSAFAAGNSRKFPAAALALIAAGSVLQGLVREYILFAMMALLLVLAAALAVAVLRDWSSGAPAANSVTKLAALGGAVVIVLGASTASYRPFQAALSEELLPAEGAGLPVPEQSPAVGAEVGDSPRFRPRWVNTPWLPDFIESRLRDLAQTRSYLAEGRVTTGSRIDPEVEFRQARDVLAYAPRAFEVSLLSPFPALWFGTGFKATSAGFRVAVVPETIVAYACLLGLPLLLLWRRQSAPVWVVLFVCTGMLMFYGLAVPNAGALQRFRFPYYLPLVCMGLAGWLGILKHRAPKTAQPSAAT